MTKKILLTAIAVLFLAFGAFADEVEHEIITLNGSVKTSYRRHAELSSGGQSYELMMPRYISEDLKDGAAVTVEGYILDADDCPRSPANPDNKLFVVTKITIGEEVINLEGMGPGKGGDRRGSGDRDGDRRGYRRGDGHHRGGRR